MAVTRADQAPALAPRHHLTCHSLPSGSLQLTPDPPHAACWAHDSEGPHRYNAVGGFIDPAPDGSLHFHIEWCGWFPRLLPIACLVFFEVLFPIAEILEGRPPFSPRLYFLFVACGTLFLIWAFTFLRWIAGARKDIVSLKAFGADIAWQAIRTSCRRWRVYIQCTYSSGG